MSQVELARIPGRYAELVHGGHSRWRWAVGVAWIVHVADWPARSVTEPWARGSPADV